MRLEDELYYEGPKSFSKKRLEGEESLFDSRATLVYTPTRNIPSRWLERGRWT
jgi:hypothetical protein